MSEEIQPVLTAEEWESAAIEGEITVGTLHILTEPDGLVIEQAGDTVDIHTGPVYGGEARVVLALLSRIAGPDGGPLFTWEMVDAIRRADEALASEGEEECRQGLEPLAARLSSLLPPRHADVLAVLGAIDRGEVPVRKTDRGTLVDYETEDGWRFRIFDDAGEWDYVDAFARPGEDWTECYSVAYREISTWTPSDATLGTVWQWFGTTDGEP